MMEAMRQLRRDHGVMSQCLALFEEFLENFAWGQEVDWDLLGALEDYMRAYPAAIHHPVEDMIYARLARRAPKLAEALADIGAEHDLIGKKARALSAAFDNVREGGELPRGAVATAGRDFLILYKNHMRKEEELFFPAAEKHLRPEDWKVASDRLHSVTDPFTAASEAETAEEARERIEGMLRDGWG